MSKKRIVVGISGATGAIYGVSLLEYLRQLPEIEIHLIVSRWAEDTIKLETGCTPQQVHSLADAWYPADALDAAVSSGSFTTGGMIILPCSMKTLSAIASGYTGELLSRAADVTIKEGRTLVLCPRETPLNAIHLENMLKLSRIGVKIVPPMPSFYQNPTTIEDLVHYQVVRVLDQLNIHIEHSGRWDKIPEAIERT